MNKKRYNQNILVQRLQTIKLVRNPLRNVKSIVVVFLIPLIFVGIIILPPALSSLVNNVTIRSSGQITVALPLHVDGRYIKNSLNETIYLRGIWYGKFADTSTGWFGLDPYTWDESALRETLQKLRDIWKVNCINAFIWGDWWLENKAVTLMGGATSIGTRDAIIRTVEIAQEYGIYVQIRLYGCTRAEGRREGQPYQPTYAWTVQDFVNFWANVSGTLKDYPHAIFTLFDEPTGDENTYFNAAQQAINAIRATGANQLIVIHFDYCGSCMWMADWVQQSRPLYNIVFSNHIYRYHGTFGYDPNAPVNIEYIRNFLGSVPGATYTGAAYKYITDTYNIPIWVSAIGAAYGYEDDNEYVAFRNTLQVLNEWEIGYVAFHAGRTALMWTLLQDASGQVFSLPNRVGQALIDAIAGIVPPSTYQLSIDSNVAAVPFNVSGSTYSTPFASSEFAGNYTVSMPSSVKVYTHNPLFGGTTVGGGGGYYSYIYTAGPYTINSSVTVSQINLYTVVAGKAKVAIYGSTTYNLTGWPDNYPHPGNLIVASAETQCQANSWNTINISSTQLFAGTYFLAVKINTSGMLTASSRGFFGQFISTNYADAFPNPFSTIAGGMAAEYAVYIPLGPIQATTYGFTYWEDHSTNPTRTINLTTNMTLTATYRETP
jgi:hypothetical protein